MVRLMMLLHCVAQLALLLAGEACHELSFTTANAYQCTYKSDMDENGVLFYIGTKGRSQQYESPTGRGVIVTTSPEPSKGDVSMLIGRTLEHCRSTASRP